MATVILPSTLARLTDGFNDIEIEGATAGEVLRRLEERHPQLRGWVLDERSHLRRHVNVFVNDERVTLDAPTASEDQVYVFQAITGGAPEAAPVDLLVGTRKGLFVLRTGDGRSEPVAPRCFPGQTVDFATFDRRSGTFFAAVSHGQYGSRLYYSDDPAGEWQQADGPVFPQETDASLERIWAVVPGERDGLLWAGVAPAALFRSTDGGRSWELVRGLWDQPSRPEWEGGLGGLALHSICPWPGDPDRLAVGISAAGVWITGDGGVSWSRGGRGLVPRYLPEDAREDALMLCVHNMHRALLDPATLYMQFHGGVYRSDDGGETWTDIASGLPADFGFPLVADPHDPAAAYVIPLNSDEDRVTAEGRVRVYRTRDRGGSWTALGDGLPATGYLNVLRQAFCHDGRRPLGLYFGTQTGEVFGSADGGDTWTLLAEHLPPIVAVRAAAR